MVNYPFAINSHHVDFFDSVLRVVIPVVHIVIPFDGILIAMASVTTIHILNFPFGPGLLLSSRQHCFDISMDWGIDSNHLLCYIRNLI